MLVLSRHKGDRIIIGDDVTILIVETKEGRCRIGIEAPKEVIVRRAELVYPSDPGCSEDAA